MTFGAPLGVTGDSDLSLNSHIKAVSAFCHLTNIAKLRDYISKADLEQLIHVFISSKFDICNGPSF